MDDKKPSKMISESDETRKLLVQSIAENIFENLKKSTDLKELIKDLLTKSDTTSSWYVKLKQLFFSLNKKKLASVLTFFLLQLSK